MSAKLLAIITFLLIAVCVSGVLSGGNCVDRTCGNTKCKKNEVCAKTFCGCFTATCANRGPPRVNCEICRLNVCVCKDNFILDVPGGKCIPICKCPVIVPIIQ